MPARTTHPTTLDRMVRSTIRQCEVVHTWQKNSLSSLCLCVVAWIPGEQTHCLNQAFRSVELRPRQSPACSSDGLPLPRSWNSRSNAYAAAIAKVENAQMAVPPWYAGYFDR